jgi:hypothetical protein
MTLHGLSHIRPVETRLAVARKMQTAAADFVVRGGW